jgi:hypothetical protein
MSKKWLLYLVVISVLVFVVTNLQYMPGPRSMFGVVTNLRIAMGWVLLLGIVMSLPVAITFIAVEWLKRNRQPGYRMKWTGAILSGIVFPAVAGASVYVGENKLSANSRNIAISHAQPLINAVEQYKQTNGTYPASFDTKSYHTGVMGIDQYYYDTIGKGYRISFKQYEALAITYQWTAYEPHTMPQQIGVTGVFQTGYKYWYYYVLYSN